MKKICLSLSFFLFAVINVAAPLKYFDAVINSDAVGGWTENDHDIAEIRHVLTYEPTVDNPSQEYGFFVTYKEIGSHKTQTVRLKTETHGEDIWVMQDYDGYEVIDYGKSAASDLLYIAILENGKVKERLLEKDLRNIVHVGTVEERAGPVDQFRVDFTDNGEIAMLRLAFDSSSSLQPIFVDNNF